MHFVYQKDIVLIREAYNQFLSHYPLCFAYWKKFADFELEYDGNETAFEVVERSVTAFPLSVDLWVHYVNLFIKFKGKNEKEVIPLFERAISNCGMDFNSNDLWQLYISWLSSHRDLAEVTAVYDRLIATPTSMLKKHFQDFTSFVEDNNPICIVSKQEYNFYMSENVLHSVETNSEDKCANIQVEKGFDSVEVC